MKVSLSVVIITFNEEKNIGRCLESVRPVADEIIVLDSFSTDRTKEICLQFPVRYFEHPFTGYIEQKNKAIEYARYQYILSLDADEVLSGVLQESIRKVKENFEYDGYFINRLTNYCGYWVRHCGWYPDRKLRLWNSQKGKWDGILIHEKVLLDKGCKTHVLTGDLLHYSYHSISQHVNQVNRFSEISARAKYENGRRISTAFTLLRMMLVFFKKYFIQLGILDGYYGLVISIMSVYTVFLKDIKLKELNKKS